MKNFNKKIITSILTFFIIILLSISIILANNLGDESYFKINKDKIYYEIKHFDNEIISMANLLNNIENKSDFYINWEELEENTYSLYSYWNSVILDLNFLNINKEDLIDFGKDLDELTISIKYKNKHKTLSNLIELYNKLTIYLESMNSNNYKNIVTTKLNLLCAYYIAEKGNWTLAHEYILEASESIYKVVNLTEINQYSQYNINQAYVAVKEMENLINIKDMNVFYFKYTIAINNLINLTI